MSFREIEAELDHLTADELHRLAMKSWTAFVSKEGGASVLNECSEEDAILLKSLDEAITKANSQPAKGYSANEVRERVKQWTSK